MVARPRRADVAAAYDLGVEVYAALWSPVILPPAAAVVEALELPSDARVVDVGAGVGGLLPAFRACAPASTVVAVDASEEMLRVARQNQGAAAVQADALALPVVDGAADAVLLAFVLFHLSDPGQALAETARVLRPGGRVGTVTWTREGSMAASTEFDAVLTEAGAPTPPVRRVNRGLDSEEAIDETLRSAGFSVDTMWLVELQHQWERDAFWALATGGGVNRMRLAALDDATGQQVINDAKTRIETLAPEAFSWWGEVVCAVATKVRS
jgi:SAM-dependent methyltransferase